VIVRIRDFGKIRDNLWHLGRAESGIYVLQGSKHSMIINGGMSCILPDIFRQIKTFNIDEGRIDKLLILHAHFDHVGIVPFLKRRHPEMEIYASARAWEILTMPKAIRTINLFSTLINEKMGNNAELSSYDLDWRDDVSGITVKEGDDIDLGGLTVSIMETPGHSSCSISAYVPEIKVLFPSDAGGIPYRDEIVPAGNSNYTLFQQNLEKLKNLDADYICADHFGYVTGEETKSFVSKTIDVAKQFRKLMESAYRKTGNVDEAVQHLIDIRYKERPDYFMSREILTGVYGQMVKHIAAALQDENKDHEETS
jgi:glyoxylase-like metal-dependent hydrolase (beta-lactamase superfamily II)